MLSFCPASTDGTNSSTNRLDANANADAKGHVILLQHLQKIPFLSDISNICYFQLKVIKIQSQS